MDLSETAMVENLNRRDGNNMGVLGEQPAQGGVVRSELTAVNLFRRLAPTHTADDNGPEEDNQEEDGHRPYYILITKEINTFMTVNTNRWLLCLEALILRINPGPEGLLPAEPAQQLIIGVLISAIMRTLRLLVGGGDPSMEPSV